MKSPRVFLIKRFMNMSVLNELLKMYGLAEVAGAKSNPELLKILKKHLPDTSDDSSVSWCGIAMAEAAERAGYKDLIPKDYFGARKWLNLSKKVEFENIKLGDVVVFWRGSPQDWRGHVGIYISHNDQNIFVLGGNQGDRVTIAPYAKDRLLGVRRIE